MTLEEWEVCRKRGPAGSAAQAQPGGGHAQAGLSWNMSQPDSPVSTSG